MTGRPARRSVAAAFAVAALGALGAPAAAQARPPSPTHVAVVVNGVGTACVPWHSGMTGAEVLTARFDVQWGQPTPSGNFAGMVVQINGVPTNPNPHTAYWAYFHNSGSGWQYSGSGALSAHPKPGTVDGWRLDSATTSAHPEPAAASYASICAGQDPTPAPPAHTTTSPPRTHAPGATTSHAVAAAPPTSAPPMPTSTGTRRAGHSPTAGPSTRGAAATTPSRTVASYAPGPRTLTASSSPAALSRHRAGGFPPWGTALAIAVVLALGGAALWRARR